jgi:hypothetical protein
MLNELGQWLHMYFVNKGFEGNNNFQSEGACPVYGKTRILVRADGKVKKR